MMKLYTIKVTYEGINTLTYEHKTANEIPSFLVNLDWLRITEFVIRLEGDE